MSLPVLAQSARARPLRLQRRRRARTTPSEQRREAADRQDGAHGGHRRSRSPVGRAEQPRDAALRDVALVEARRRRRRRASVTSCMNIIDTAVRRSSSTLHRRRAAARRARRPSPCVRRAASSRTHAARTAARADHHDRDVAVLVHQRDSACSSVSSARDARRICHHRVADLDQAQALQRAVGADEIGDEGVDRMREDVVGRVELLELAGAEDRDACRPSSPPRRCRG